MSGHHILFISSWYPDRYNPSHGIFNRAFAEAVAKRSRVSVLHVSPAETITGDQHEPAIIEEENLFTVNLYYPARSGNSLFARLRQFLRRRKAFSKGFEIIRQRAGMPSVVQLNVVFPAGSEALRISRKFGIPLVVNECWTGYDPLDGRYDRAAVRLFSRPVFKHASVIMPVTTYLEWLMKDHGIPGSYKVVPNVVDTRVFFPVLKKKGAYKRLIHVSALDDAQKNVSGIIEAFALVKKTDAALELVIVGNGPDAQALKKKAATLVPAGGITFKGRLAANEVASEMRMSDALVMFSNYETLCVAVPEALACGVPVITSDAGGIMSYFDERLGLIVPKGNIPALAGAIRDFYNGGRSFDPQMLAAFAETNFSAEKICGLLHEVYDSALAEK